MKRISIIIAVLALCAAFYPNPVLAQDATTWGSKYIAGAGVGYGVAGPGDKGTYVSQFIGFKAKGWENAALYTLYQHASVPGIDGLGGSGAKALLLSPWAKHPEWSLGLGVGFLTDLRGNPEEGPLETGMTAEGMIGYSWSDWLSLVAHGMAWDRGDVNGDGANDVSWFVHGAIAVKDFPGL